MAERVLVRQLEPNLWQWRAVTGLGQWQSEAFYTGDINLLKETIAGRSVWLIFPGVEMVSQRVVADIKDRRQLLKALPFEVEDDVINPIEDLHFAFGAVEDGTIPLAYGDFERLQKYIAEVEGAGSDVERCLIDYQLMERPEQGWTLLLENGLLIAHTGVGVGFAIEQVMAPVYLEALSGSDRPERLLLVADDAEGLTTLRELLPESVLTSETVSIEDREGGFWDLVDPLAPPEMECRTGALARKLPLHKWWQDWKAPLAVTAAAFVLALGTTWMAQNQADQQRRVIMATTDEIFRQVVPEGNITDPERQLRGLVGRGGSGSAQTSNAVVLLAAVAPAIKEQGRVKVRNFRYNLDNAQLQMNIEADSFAAFETLRSKIAEGGYRVDIQSASVQGNVHQAQMRVSEAG